MHLLLLKDCLPSSKKIRYSWRAWKPSSQPRVKQELKINPIKTIKRTPSNPWQIRRFSNNPNAQRVEWNIIFRSVQKKKRDSSLQKEAKKRNERLPGPEKSIKRDGQHPQNEQVEEEDDSACFMCFALGCSSFRTHDAEKCKKGGVFSTKVQDPEHREELVRKLASRSKAAARSDQASERTGMQQNPTRNPKHERSAQSQQGQMSYAQQMQQMQPQMYAGYRGQYSQPMMSPLWSM
jgi:hypothetical protein